MPRSRPPALFVAALFAGALFAPFALTQGTGAPPDDTPELRRRAEAAERRQEWSEAADLFAELTRREPARPDFAVSAGRCLGMSGRFGDALDLLQASLERFPGMIDLEAMLARTLLLRTERDPGIVHPEVSWADAIELAEQVLHKDPAHQDARLILAQARYLRGDTPGAIAAAEESVRRHPREPGGHVLLGRIALDRFRALRRSYDADQPGGQAEADLVAAIAAERQRASTALGRAAELDPGRAYPFAALAQLAWLDGRRDEARSHLQDALARDPDTEADVDLLTEGLSWQERRDLWRELRNRYAAATNALPRKTATLWFHEGRANLDGLEFGAARACFAQAAAGNPAAKNADYYLFLCTYYLEDYDAAEQHAAAYAAAGAAAFADVLRGLPSQERAQIGAMVRFLGHRAFARGELARSRDLNHVMACLEDSADAWNNHAFLCRETGRFEQAFASYQYALQKEPSSPQLWNDAAVILQFHLPTPDHLVKARSMYDRAIKLAEAVQQDPQATPGAKQAAAEAAENARKNIAELP